MYDKNIVFRTDYIIGAFLTKPFDFPLVKGVSEIPNKLIPFNYANSAKDKNQWICFFLDDIQFERVWTNPYRYINTLAEYNGIIGTDFSAYIDFPKALQIYNIYRNRCLDYFFIQQGLKVIPTACWSTSDSFDWCFNGIKKGSSVAVATNGCINTESQARFKVGYDVLLEKVEPEFVVCYGKKFDWMGDNVYDCECELEKRLRKSNQKKKIIEKLKSGDYRINGVNGEYKKEE